ncbi:hypothetical protein IEQ34_011486 [Dendrobium chrysotoxum]|uniref:Uncharacterized protein n=1 Tax=Dendrobium chrysotoxum TaxID=161865 RepID=A0AAV7GT01_DENCH|nr:hypothetical protein IEQ34_011486 [Dendrobium chrysotoxum]
MWGVKLLEWEIVKSNQLGEFVVLSSSSLLHTQLQQPTATPYVPLLEASASYAIVAALLQFQLQLEYANEAIISHRYVKCICNILALELVSSIVRDVDEITFLGKFCGLLHLEIPLNNGKK